MEKFFEVVRTLEFADLLRLLAITVPLVAAIWAAMLWAFKARLESLEASLRLHREDAAIRLRQALEEQNVPLTSKIDDLKQQLEAEKEKFRTLRVDLEMLHELTETITDHEDLRTQLWRELDDKYFHIRGNRRKKLYSGEQDEYREPRYARVLQTRKRQGGGGHAEA